MRKIAVISDLHLDLNQINVEQAIAVQVAYLRRHHYQDYLIAGDLFNDFALTQQFVAALAAELAPDCRVFFIAGNHDMAQHVTYAQLNQLDNPHYVHRRLVVLPETDYVLIGNNGWYDYSFMDYQPQVNMTQWKKTFWFDQRLQQPQTDPERFQQELLITHRLLEQARQMHKKVLFMTHFVPRREFIPYGLPARLQPMLGVLGAWHLGALLAAYNVPYVVFGHLHRKMQPVQIQTTRYYSCPLGYHRQRRNEWRFGTDFTTEWQQTLGTILLPDPSE